MNEYQHMTKKEILEDYKTVMENALEHIKIFPRVHGGREEWCTFEYYDRDVMDEWLLILVIILGGKQR